MILEYNETFQQVFLTEAIAAAEACKLTAVVNAAGKEAITALIVRKFINIFRSLCL